MANKTVIDYIRENDPEYDPLPRACEAAKIPLELVRQAKGLVYFDGYYGPMYPHDYVQEQPDDPIRHCLTVDKALGILQAVAEEIEDYKTTMLEYCNEFLEDEDNCSTCKNEGGHEVEYEVTDACEIADALFPFVHEIYGVRITGLNIKTGNYQDVLTVWENRDKGVEAALAAANLKPLEVD